MLIISTKKGLMLVTRIKGYFVSLLIAMSHETELFGSHAGVENVD